MIDFKLKIPFFLIGILLIISPINPKAQLTFLHNGGRLGDVFTDALRVIYLAQKYNLELCFNNTIPYLEHFTIDKMYTMRSLHKRKKRLHHEKILLFARDKTAYLGYRTTNIFYPSLYANSDCFDYLFKYYIENISFRNEVTRYLSLRKTFNKPKIPEGYISVAMHIRKGSGFDVPPITQQYRSESDFLLKFPAEQYYVDQLTFLCTIVYPEPVYARIFTDNSNPYELITRMQAHLTHLNVELDYQESGSEIEDLYYMSTFDFLIRPRSGFSIAAQILGNHKGIILPTDYQWEKNYLNVTESVMLIPDRERYLLRIVQASHENIGEIKELYGLSTHQNRGCSVSR